MRAVRAGIPFNPHGRSRRYDRRTRTVAGSPAVPPRRPPPLPRTTADRGPASRRRAVARRLLGVLALAALPGCAATDLLIGGTRAAIETGTAVGDAARGVGRGVGDGVTRLGDLTPAGVRDGVAALAAPDGPFDPDRRDYLGDPTSAETIAHSTGLHEPAWDKPPAPNAVSDGPARVGDLDPAAPRGGEIWDLSLDEAIRLTLQRTEVVREQAQFGANTNPLLAAPLAVVTVFDPAIQETGVGFNRGPEAALADFDAQFTTSLTGTRDERIQNNRFVIGTDPGETLVTEDVAFRSRLLKQTATGGTIALSHDVDRTFNNVNPDEPALPQLLHEHALGRFPPAAAGRGGHAVQPHRRAERPQQPVPGEPRPGRADRPDQHRPVDRGLRAGRAEPAAGRRAVVLGPSAPPTACTTRRSPPATRCSKSTGTCRSGRTAS